MKNIESLVQALRYPEMEVYYHGDVREDAAELLDGECSLDAWKDACEEMASLYPAEDFLSEVRDDVYDLLQKGVLKEQMIEGLKKISQKLEDIEMEEFQAGETGRAELRKLLKKQKAH